MRNEWTGSSAFWLPFAAPLFMIAVFGAAVDVQPAHAERSVLVAALGIALACAAGIRLARRDQRIQRLMDDDDAADGEGSSLSAEQAATYRDLFENATDIVFTTDLSGHFLAGNRAVQRQLGYTVEEAKSLTWERLVAPYDMWKARQMYKRHAAGEKRISFELDTVTASGEIRTFEIGSRPMFRGGELCGFHGIARDVTSRKEMEQQLEAARREAEIANQSKSTFLANMSHEIRTPINGILGFLSLFARTGLTPEQQKCLVPVEESARHLVKIIDDILDLSKIEAGRFSIDNEIFSFRDAVGGAVDLLRPMGESKGLAVYAEFESAIPELAVGDGTRIGQVVSNLVSNAIKFTDAGSVSVHCRVKETAAAHVSVAVAVVDTGIGIAPEDQALLFEPFRQLDGRTDRRYSGTGLGLTISRNLVETMGGDIRVHSEPGRGTEVKFELPLRFAPADIGASERNSEDLLPGFDGNGLSGLIVDDNEINRRYLEAVLNQYGIVVTQAASGSSALAACSRHRFDVVFMDIHMANMDGVEATRRLRAQFPEYRGVPVVAVSADVVGDSGVRFTAQGLDRFMPKPVRERDLAGMLAALFPDRAGDDGAVPVSVPDDGEPDGAAPVLDKPEGIALASRDETLWRRSVDVLRSQVREIMPALGTAVKSGDHAQARQLAHKLAGSAACVAAAELAACARALEQACRDGDPATEAHRLAATEAASERFLDFDAGPVS
ncbi:MAG: ATP-binding protein [Gammaproteobacteria bacterium]|nr:ATP-binding protein [Gammaproteobacteria bacterium]